MEKVKALYCVDISTSQKVVTDHHVPLNSLFCFYASMVATKTLEVKMKGLRASLCFGCIVGLRCMLWENKSEARFPK